MRGLTTGDNRACVERQTTNLMRFRSFYGSNPLVYVAILEDLQMTDLPDAHVDPAKLCLPSFLLALNFLREYRMEHQRAGLFKVCERTAREGVQVIERNLPPSHVRL